MKKIGIILDFVCPYCFVGEKVMHKALGEKVNEFEFEFFPFELNPEPNPLKPASPDGAKYLASNILPWATEQGIEIKYPTLDFIPRTALAFESLLVAKEFGKELALVGAIMDAIWLHSKNVGEVSVLGEVAATVGLDRAYFEEALTSGKYREQHAKQNAEVSDWDFDVVPTFYVDGERVMEFPRTVEEWKALI